MKCKWLSDDDQEVCVNADCPVCADFCPVTRYPEICKFAEMEGQKRTNGDKMRGMTDEKIVGQFVTDFDGSGALIFNCPAETEGMCCDKECKECFSEWLKQEVQNA